MISAPPEPPDLYAILGVDRDATEAEIESAFRRRAVEMHPDLRPDDEIAADRFRPVREAYEVLSDPKQRQRYDALQVEIAEPVAARPSDDLIIRSGSPRGNVPVGCAADLLQTGLVLLLGTALMLLLPSDGSYFEWLLHAGPGVMLGIVWLFRIWYQRHRDRPPDGKVCLVMNATGLYDERTHLRIAWDAVRGYLMCWPEDWLDLELTPDAARQLRAEGRRVREQSGRSYHRISLRGTDGELVDVERHLEQVLRLRPDEAGAVREPPAFT